MDHTRSFIAIISGLIAIFTVYAVAVGVYQTTFNTASEASNRYYSIQRDTQNIQNSFSDSSNSFIKNIENGTISKTNDFIIQEQDQSHIIVDSQQCSDVNGFCTTSSSCANEGGYDTKAICSSGGSYNLTCCIPKSPAQNESRTVLEDQCTSTFGGTCTTGNTCKSQGGTIAGTCWDGGITTLGVCCVGNDSISSLARSRDPLSCIGNTGRIGNPNEPIFCRDCALKYCSSYAKDIDEVATKCTSPIGQTVARECCYDRDFDNICDPEPGGYCCKTINRGP